ncbi:MAG: hypothetical protein DRJ06_01255 [Candidatus Aminicenantes bacterium]|nr:MAG: hypothetical protein DRJ06_01255 [Candidatus Aminicenantes bacterium]
MRVFELFFNPPGKKPSAREKALERGKLFDSFCYQPENIYEKRLGSLYILGELKNPTPRNLRLLEKISQLIKDKYYSNYLKSSEGALKESLKSLNNFLAQELKKDNTEWMGGLSLAVFSLAPLSGPWVNLNLALLGDIKILLLREGQVFDIGKKLEGQEIEPYPLKVFSNIVSGKIHEADTILGFTKSIFEVFQARSIISKISNEKELDDKKIKAILKPNREELTNVSGICLIVQAQSESQPRSIISFEKKLEGFSLAGLLRCFSRLKNLAGLLKRTKKIPVKIPVSSDKLSKIATFAFLKKINNKPLVLFLILICLLSIGAFLNQRENRKEIQLVKNTLHNIDSEVNRAEELIQSKKEEQADIILRKALRDISFVIEKNTPLKKTALDLKKSIEEKLKRLNKVENIDNPNVLVNLSEKKLNFAPYRMVFSSGNLYFYNPLSDKIYRFEIKENKGTLIPAKKNITLGIAHHDSVLFFVKPHTLLLTEGNKIQEKTINLPDFKQGDIFGSNVYFLEPKSGEIIKQSLLSKNKKGFWLASGTKKAVSARSISVDGSIWVLTKENEIDRYYRGRLKQTLKPKIFPELENLTKIWTCSSLPYIYCLEPDKKRLIVLDKKGKIVKQYQSEKFNNLLDFAVSEKEKTIYLLNGSEVFNIPFSLF